MAIELDIPLPRREPALAYKKAVAAEWFALGFRLSNGVLTFSDRTGDSFCIEADDLTSVYCNFYVVEPVPGYPDDPDEPDGTWVTVAVGRRNRESMVLMTIAAAALAKVADSPVYDESQRLDSGRILDRTRMAAITESFRNRSLSDAATRFAASFPSG